MQEFSNVKMHTANSACNDNIFVLYVFEFTCKLLLAGKSTVVLVLTIEDNIDTNPDDTCYKLRRQCMCVAMLLLRT